MKEKNVECSGEDCEAQKGLHSDHLNIPLLTFVIEPGL